MPSSPPLQYRVGLHAGSTLPRAAEASPPDVRLVGVVSDTVGNAATRNLLEGAMVELPQLRLSVLTDNTGRFVIPSVPAGSHAIVASYIGLNPMRTQVTVNAGTRTTRDFELTTEIYKLDEFKVVGEREGSAARSKNILVSWRYRAFNARVLFNENASFLSAVAASPARNVFQKKVTVVNAGVGYQYRAWLTFTCDVTNLFNEPIVFYVARQDHMSQTVINGTKLELGMNGRF